MIIDEILNYLSDKSNYCDVRYMETENNSMAYKNGEFMGIDFNKDHGYAIRCVNNSISMGFISTENFDDAKNIIDNVLKKSLLNGKNKINKDGDIQYSWSNNGIKKIENVSNDDKINFLKDNDKLMESLDAKIRINSLSDKKVKQIYKNSYGSYIKSDYSRIFYAYIIGVIENNEFEQSSEEYGATTGYEYLDNIDFDNNIKNDVKSLKNSIKSKHIKPGNYDLIAGNEISGIVSHESCGHPMEYDRIIGREAAQAGESFIKLNNYPVKIGSDIVNLIDDPTIHDSYGYYLYDDEGIKARKRYLYKNGYTNEFLLNRESSAIANLEPNGGGRSSSWDMEPLARMSTTYIEPKDYNFDELIEDVKNGIYMKNFTEWNIDDVRFNEKYVGKEAYLIKNGEIKEQIRRPVLETNTVKFYSSIDAVGNDLKFNAGLCGKGDPEQGVEVWMGGPHIRLRNVFMK